MSVATLDGIPDAALDAHMAIIGKTGSGKSFAARGMVERLIEQGRRVVWLDPMGQAWGLKAKADGSPGYPVTVVGGDHGDIPIEVAKGAHLGAFVAKSQGCFVLDTSDLRRPDTVRFVGAFLAALYALNRDPIWICIDEADFYAPQNGSREMALLAHEVDQIARRGRARGFRLWTITQRPARIDKSVISQAASMLVMKLLAPQDRRAVEDWLGGNVEDADAVCDALPQLPRGEGFFWNPDLGLAGRVAIPRIKTLDTGFTPSADAKPIHATLAAVDVAALRLALGAPEPPRSPEAIRAEAYAQGRSDGARAERERMRAILGEALQGLQEPPDAVSATILAADPPDPPPAPEIPPPRPPSPDDRHVAAIRQALTEPPSNDAVQRAILGRIARPMRLVLEKVLEHGEQRVDDLQRRAGMERAPGRFSASLKALEGIEVISRQGSIIRPTERLYPLGFEHR